MTWILDPIQKSLHAALVVKALRPERVIFAIENFVKQVFHKNFLDLSETHLKDVILNETKAETALVFCSVPGYDASYRVEHLANEVAVPLNSVAMGSAEGFELAEKAIQGAVRTGTWVLLKNCHLAPRWLAQLEKKLHSLKPNPKFRLFLTLEMNPKIPANILLV
jgi:dynein heavy chain 1